METFDAIFKRRSIRKYKDTNVPEKLIEKIRVRAKTFINFINPNILFAKKKLVRLINSNTNSNPRLINNFKVSNVLFIKGKMLT